MKTKYVFRDLRAEGIWNKEDKQNCMNYQKQLKVFMAKILDRIESISLCFKIVLMVTTATGAVTRKERDTVDH